MNAIDVFNRLVGITDPQVRAEEVQKLWNEILEDAKPEDRPLINLWRRQGEEAVKGVTDPLERASISLNMQCDCVNEMVSLQNKIVALISSSLT